MAPANVRPAYASVLTDTVWPTLTRDRYSAGTFAASSARSRLAILHDRLCRGAVHLFTDADHAFDDLAGNRRPHVRALDVAIGGTERRRGLFDGRLCRRHLRPRVFDFLARRDAPLEQLLIPLQIEPGVFDLRPSLFEDRGGLPSLIVEGAPIELGDGLALSHGVALGHRHRLDPPRHQGAHLHIVVRGRCDGAAHDQFVGQRRARDLRHIGHDRRHVGRRGLLFVLLRATTHGYQRGDEEKG